MGGALSILWLKWVAWIILYVINVKNLHAGNKTKLTLAHDTKEPQDHHTQKRH